MNTILHQRQLEEYYCTLCYAIFDLKRRVVTLANSGLPYPIRASAEGVSQIELPGVPLGSFHGSAYDELTYALHPGDLFVFCSDGVSEAMTANGDEFGSARLIEVVQQSRELAPRAIVDAIQNGKRPAGMAKDEEAVYNFCTELLQTKQVGDATFAAAKAAVGEKGVVDLIGVMGWYQTVSMLLNVDRYPLPEGQQPELKPIS